MIGTGVSGSWTFYQWRQARKREAITLRTSIEELAAKEEHRLTQIESSLASHEEMLNHHEARLNLLGHK